MSRAAWLRDEPELNVTCGVDRPPSQREPRTGHVLQRPRERAARHRRHLLDGARTCSGRHSLLPVRIRRRSPDRRAEPEQGDGVQELARWARPRWRQGGHHWRPGDGQDRAVASGLRQVPARACRPIHHGVRRGDGPHGHGRGRTRVRRRHRAQRGQRRRRELRRAHGVRGARGHARGGPAPLGIRRPARAEDRHRRRRQGRPRAGGAGAPRRGRHRHHRRRAGRRRAGGGRPSGGSRCGRRRRAGAVSARRLRAVRARWSAQ